MSVIGVRLGEPVEASGISVCPYRGQYDARGRKLPMLLPKGAPLCIDADSPFDGYSRLDGLPDIGVSYSANITSYQGRIRDITFRLAGRAEVKEMLEVLKDRYGNPVQTISTPMTTLGGATFNAQIWIWEGSAVRIEFADRVVSIDEASVSFIHMKTQQQESDEKLKRTKAGASRL